MKNFNCHRNLEPGDFPGRQTFPEPCFYSFPALKGQVGDVEHADVDLSAATGADGDRMYFRKVSGNSGVDAVKRFFSSVAGKIS
jgi:hypothetical protein